MSSISSSFSFFMGMDSQTNTSQSTGQASQDSLVGMCSGSMTESNGASGIFEAMMTQSGANGAGSGDSSGSNMTMVSSASLGNISQLFNFMDQLMTDAENMLENIGSNSTATTQAASTATSDAANTDLSADYSSDFGQSVLAGNGPLPAFLQEVDAKDGLNATQAQSLQDIAVEFQNASGDSTTVKNIDAALQQAGIPNTGV